MRLKELQQQRCVSRLEERVRHLREQVASRDRDMFTLEQRLVQTAKVIYLLYIAAVSRQHSELLCCCCDEITEYILLIYT